MKAARLVQPPQKFNTDDATRFSSVALERLFEQCFGEAFNTQLRGGAQEPFYQAATADGEHRRGTESATIFYRADYFRSAMHEVAHWCVAGAQRRQQDDYGYWYAPDGRSAEQQQAFEQLEVLPQAWELIFCAAANHPFGVSIDNLDGGAANMAEFQQAVSAKAEALLRDAPRSHRGMLWSTALAEHFRGMETVSLGDVRGLIEAS